MNFFFINMQIKKQRRAQKTRMPKGQAQLFSLYTPPCTLNTMFHRLVHNLQTILSTHFFYEL